MAKSKGIDMKLPSVDNLFTTQEQRDEEQRENVRDIAIAEIRDFPNHPFKVKADEKMLEMAESVKEHGVLMPALVRPRPEGGYEMVAGHRRKMASELAGKEEMPCLVRNLTDDEATIIMVDSNLQREVVLPSEKAFAYKMKLDAMKRQQGYRTDLTSATDEEHRALVHYLDIQQKMESAQRREYYRFGHVHAQRYRDELGERNSRAAGRMLPAETCAKMESESVQT